MNFRKLLLAGAATTVASATFITPTQAAIIDRPHFKVEPIIIVWATDVSGDVAIVTDFLVGSGPTPTDLINEDGYAVQTGSLSTTSDSYGTISALMNVDGIHSDVDVANAVAGALGAFAASETVSGSSNTQTWQSSFYVATNTAFSINAQATPSIEDGDFAVEDIGFELAKNFGTGEDGGETWGAQSQDPGGSFTSVSDLSDLASATLVYDGTGGTRTASGSGTISQQSVRFDATYTFAPEGYDLSMGSGEIQADVVYTFFAA